MSTTERIKDIDILHGIAIIFVWIQHLPINLIYWLLAIIAGSLYLNQISAFGSVKASIEGAFAALFQIANFRFMSCFTHYECELNTVPWSLLLEQQFYFVFPKTQACIVFRS